MSPSAFLDEFVFANGRCHDLEIGFRDDRVQVRHEPFANFSIEQNGKRSFRLTNLMLVQHHHVMAKVPKLEFLKRRRNDGRIFPLVENTKG